MKGIYLTEEAQQDIYDRIKSLEQMSNEDKLCHEGSIEQEVKFLKEIILSSAVVIPVEESWKKISDIMKIDSGPDGYLTNIHYPNGVVIQPK